VKAEPISVWGKPGAADAILAYVSVSRAWVARMPSSQLYQ
jgi:hypothetical protein